MHEIILTHSKIRFVLDQWFSAHHILHNAHLLHSYWRNFEVGSRFLLP